MSINLLDLAPHKTPKPARVWRARSPPRSGGRGS